LTVRDSREAAKIFINLASREGGYGRITQQKYTLSPVEPLPSQSAASDSSTWQIPATWSSESNGLPNVGTVNFVWEDGPENMYDVRHELAKRHTLCGTWGTFIAPADRDEMTKEGDTKEDDKLNEEFDEENSAIGEL